MDEFSVILFKKRDALYGIEAQRIKAILKLPEITLLPQGSSHFLGIITFQDKISYIINFDSLLGFQNVHYKTSDYLMIINVDQTNFGLVVDEVLDIQNVPLSKIEQISEHYFQEQKETRLRLIENVVTHNQSSISIISTERLKKLREYTSTAKYESSVDSDKTPHYFSHDATEEEKAIFRERVKRLYQWQDSEQTESSQSVAIFQVGQEKLALPLTYIKEFCKAVRINPVPCCPGHIVGNINLRGEILTIVNVCPLLDMEDVDSGQMNKVVVVEKGDLVFGILAANIDEVTEIRASQINPISYEISSRRNIYLDGVYNFQDEVIGILNLENLLKDDRMIVNSS